MIGTWSGHDRDMIVHHRVIVGGVMYRFAIIGGEVSPLFPFFSGAKQPNRAV